MSQQQRYLPPNLLTAPDEEVKRWLQDRTATEVVPTLAETLMPVLESRRQIGLQAVVGWTLVAIGLTAALLGSMLPLTGLMISFIVMMAPLGMILLLAGLPSGKALAKRPRWLRELLQENLKQGGRALSLSDWICGVEALNEDRRWSYEALAKRLATATSEELRALTLAERAWLRGRLKDEWPGEALQVALLLALGTAGDIYTKPYARRCLTDPRESEAVREAAEECLRALERLP